MSAAKTLFHKGDRVAMPPCYRCMFPLRSYTGVIAGAPRSRRSISVRVDGARSAATWSTDFWARPRDCEPIQCVVCGQPALDGFTIAKAAKGRAWAYCQACDAWTERPWIAA